jgi:hypothetical protein
MRAREDAALRAARSTIAALERAKANGTRRAPAPRPR